MPLHERLPIEILETILQLCVGCQTPVRDLLTLQLVRRSWRDIIVNASVLWSTISAEEDEPALREALQMAKDSSLNIMFIEKSNKTDQRKFFKLVGERVNQCRSLVVQSRRSDAALAVLPTQRPPNLGTLHVIAGHNMSPQKGTPFCLEGVPQWG